jgi:hypothetical protein
VFLFQFTWPFDQLATLEKRLLFFVIAASLSAMYILYEYFVPSVPAWVQFKILRLQHEVMVPEDLRQERHSLESKIHTRKVFMMPLEDMKRWASGKSLLVTPGRHSQVAALQTAQVPTGTGLPGQAEENGGAGETTERSARVSRRKL